MTLRFSRSSALSVYAKTERKRSFRALRSRQTCYSRSSAKRIPVIGHFSTFLRTHLLMQRMLHYELRIVQSSLQQQAGAWAPTPFLTIPPSLGGASSRMWNSWRTCTRFNNVEDVTSLPSLRHETLGNGWPFAHLYQCPVPLNSRNVWAT